MYQVTLSQKQLEVIQSACEFYGRIHMGQLETVRELCPKHMVGTEDYYELFNELMVLSPKFTGLRFGACYSISTHEISENARVAWDIYQVFKDTQVWENFKELPSNFPLKMWYDSPVKVASVENFPVVEKIDENN